MPREGLGASVPATATSARLIELLKSNVIRSTIGLARQTGWGLPLVNAIRSKFGGLTPGDAGYLARLTRGAMDAGTLASTLNPSQKMRLADVPINPLLFGSQPAGRRYEYQLVLQYRNPSSGVTNWVTVFHEASVLEPIAVIQAIAEGEADFMLGKGKYDDLTGGRGFVPQFVDMNVVAVQRRY